jgi:hypothetical protein
VERAKKREKTEQGDKLTRHSPTEQLLSSELRVALKVERTKCLQAVFIEKIYLII